ncbi:hypothetical protein CPB86DRAFT_696734 [Serendipita vermifera]|nr:hypothetical protein CPB86DRAFT_696734 [Serendipita vermifera]
MTSFTASIENLFHAIWQILAGLTQSFVAVGTSIVALAQDLVKATFNIFSALFRAVVNLMSGFVGFVLGNIFIILAIGAAYWFWATQTAAGRKKTAGGQKNPLKS